jgi:hypothetical protein
MELLGAEELKEAAKHLRIFHQNRTKHSIDGIILTNYLWIAKRGGGITTAINAFAEYLYNAKILKFTGSDKYFEYRLSYDNAPEEMLANFRDTIEDLAGHHRYFRGLACIDINEWVQHTNEPVFGHLLDYIASKNDKMLTIFYLHTDGKRSFKNIEAAISAHVPFETVSLRFPNTDELLEHIESKIFRPRNFSFTDDAKELLTETIAAISGSPNFNGFKTVNMLANSILNSILRTEICDNTVSADMLANFSKDSAGIMRIKRFIRPAMGFTSQKEEC